MRTIYLVRHGMVAFQDHIRRCIGWTDIPLSDAGRKQAGKLAQYFTYHPVETVYCSPLDRAAETARILAAGRFPVETVERLKELYMGEWENVPLADLKKTLEAEPQSGEGRVHGLHRMRETAAQLLRCTTGDIAIVAHAGINCCFLSYILGTPLETSRALRQPYGGISIIEVDEAAETMTVKALGINPGKVPDQEEISELRRRYGTPEQVTAHCEAVARKALEIGERLEQAGCSLDLEVIAAAAKLHDLLRTKPRHAEAGADAVEKEGYLQTADVIRQHHELREVKLDEAAVVFLADKLVRGEETVSLEQRFAKSRERFQDNPEAMAAHDRRYRQAVAIEAIVRDTINSDENIHIKEKE